MELLIPFIVFASILALYVVFFLVDVIFVLVFKTTLKNKARSIFIALNQKYESISALIALYKKNGVEIDEQIIDQFNSIDTKNLYKTASKEFKDEIDKLNVLKMTLVSISNKNENIGKHNEFISLVEIINNLDSQIRGFFAKYNSAVLGYNYWINFGPFAPIFRLSKINNRELIA